MERTTARQQLLATYASTLRAVAGDKLVRAHLTEKPLTASCCVVAIGKAAEAMALGAQQGLGEWLQRGLLITKRGYLSRRFDARWQCIEAGHPLPDTDSLGAGTALLDFLRDAPAECELLFLISGGTSALVEVLPESIPPDQLQRINQWLLGSGLDIAAMNRVRKQLSAIKAGRLAGHLRGRRCRNLLLSDVPGSDPKVIGSGLLAPHTLDDISSEALDLPEWIAEAIGHAPPLPPASTFEQIDTEILANNGTARHAAQQAALLQGIPVELHDDDFQGDAIQLGSEFARTLLNGPARLHIWGGEATVKLPAQPGRGGRCQQLALAAALTLAGSKCLLLAAGSDGSDGPGEDAGALVDGDSVMRGEEEGFNARQALRNADAGSFLEASGDLIQTGPTGSNVMDLVLGWNPA
jgi:glycerate 2-kinase